MHSRADRLSIADLATLAGVPIRTIRYYINERLLPGPAGRGKAAAYTQEHVDRLRLIRRLTEQRVPLAEQRERLSLLSETEVRTLLSEEEERAQELRVAETEAPGDYLAALLRRAQAARGKPSEPMSPSYVPPAPSDLASGAEMKTSYPKESWRRIELGPGLELHIREDAAGLHSALIQRLLTVAGVRPRS